MAHRAHLAQRLPGGGRVQLPHGRARSRQGLRRAQVDREPRLRGDAQGGDGRGGAAPPGGPLLPGADRRHLRRTDHRRGGRAARDPGAQPRRRLPLGLRAAHVRLDRGRRVGAAGARRRLRAAGRDGRGAARHGAGPGGQGHRQPDGDDPGGRGAAALRGGAGLTRRPRPPRGRSTRRCWRPWPRESARRTWAGTPPAAGSPTRSSRACGPSSRSGRRCRRASGRLAADQASGRRAPRTGRPRALCPTGSPAASRAGSCRCFTRRPT